jgi:hypothetical protein
MTRKTIKEQLKDSENDICLGLSRKEMLLDIIRCNSRSVRWRGSGNRSLRRIASRHRYATIASRTLSNDGPNRYRFSQSFGSLGNNHIAGAIDERVFHVGDVVEIDSKGTARTPSPMPGLLVTIVKLVSDAGRQPDTVWGAAVDPEVAARFPLPDSPDIPVHKWYVHRNVQNVEVWRNNAGALLEVVFIPAHWTFFNRERKVHPPSLQFRSLGAVGPGEDDKAPRGYMRPARAIRYTEQPGGLFVDTFSNRLDDFFIARWCFGERPRFGSIKMPPLGAALQEKHFLGRSPREILTGQHHKRRDARVRYFVPSDPTIDITETIGTLQCTDSELASVRLLVSRAETSEAANQRRGGIELGGGDECIEWESPIREMFDQLIEIRSEVELRGIDLALDQILNINLPRRREILSALENYFEDDDQDLAEVFTALSPEAFIYGETWDGGAPGLSGEYRTATVPSRLLVNTLALLSEVVREIRAAWSISGYKEFAGAKARKKRTPKDILTS